MSLQQANSGFEGNRIYGLQVHPSFPGLVYSRGVSTNCPLVIAADGLYKRDVFSKLHRNALPKTCQNADQFMAIGFPDPFAVATVDGEQTQTTSVIKKTLNPYWNESFDVYGSR